MSSFVFFFFFVFYVANKKIIADVLVVAGALIQLPNYFLFCFIFAKEDYLATFVWERAVFAFRSSHKVKWILKIISVNMKWPVGVVHNN